MTLDVTSRSVLYDFAQALNSVIPRASSDRAAQDILPGAS